MKCQCVHEELRSLNDESRVNVEMYIAWHGKAFYISSGME